ncbi:MAG: serine/threonine protein kinase, partial [Acidobacteria bacterium]|nr:serine/threonine protein kinase [Acidobacteriota bacterium]
MGSKTILNYELAERIGGGGMGVVWRAVDKKLGREVALKFLPGATASDAQYRQRFIREA